MPGHLEWLENVVMIADAKNGSEVAIRPCNGGDRPAIVRIINAAAGIYRGAIPDDCWHEPYMPIGELESEIAAGIEFSGFTVGGELVGVMGVQNVKNVRLIRHAYVLPEWQGRRIGSKLLETFSNAQDRPILIGTWRAAVWAIAFYQRHGFGLVPNDAVALLLNTYWTVPERQIESSVVLASPALTVSDAALLVDNANVFPGAKTVTP